MLPGFAELCEVTSEVVVEVPGANMCAPTALTNMGLADGQPSQSNMANGPYSYRQLQAHYHLAFTQAPFEELICAE